MDLSPNPILDAADGYRGEFADLDTGRTVSAAVFHVGRRELADRLARSGLQAGHRAVVAVDNGPHFVATLLAILERGGCPLLVHPKMPAPELKRVALRFGCSMVMVPDGA